MRFTLNFLTTAALLAPLAIAPNTAQAGRTGQIVLRGVVGPLVNARAVVQTAANGPAFAIACNGSMPIRVSLERGRFEAAAATASAGGDGGPRFISTWHSSGDQAFACERAEQELLVPMPPNAPGESVTAKISIN